MPEKNMRDEFQRYVERTRQIRDLSSPSLAEIGDEGHYSEVLARNFTRIGVLAGENRRMIRDYIEPILQMEGALEEETVAEINELIAQLMNASQLMAIDMALVDQLGQRLARDARDKGDEAYYIQSLDKIVEDSYLMLTQIKRIAVAEPLADQYRQRGAAALEALMAYLPPEKFQALSMESRTIVMVNARYGAALYESLGPLPAEYAQRRLEILERAVRVSIDPFYHELLPDYNWKYHFFRMYEYFYQTDARSLPQKSWQRIAAVGDRLMELYDSDPDYFARFRGHKEIEGRCLRAHYRAGDLSLIDYQEKIYAIFESRNPLDYSPEGFAENLELPMYYLRTLNFSTLSDQESQRAAQIYHSALLYLFHAPKHGSLGTLLDNFIMLAQEFHEVPRGPSFEDFCLRAMAAVHPPTYIHSRMVAELAQCLTGWLLRLAPERLVGMDGYTTLEQVKSHRQKILDYAFHAALCHDIGKLPMIDTIFVYGRDLLDVEFQMIRLHPMDGAKIMAQHASTQAYTSVALRHHEWADGSRGYPVDPIFSGAVSNRVMIDLVACADCMDAATDGVGRSYKSGKSLEEFIAEVEAEAGTRYAAWLPDLLNHPEVQKDLKQLLAEKRDTIYRETYRLLKDLGALSE